MLKPAFKWVNTVPCKITAANVGTYLPPYPCWANMCIFPLPYLQS